MKAKFIFPAVLWACSCAAPDPSDEMTARDVDPEADPAPDLPSCKGGAPPAPSAPTMARNDDSGISNTDNVTRITHFHLLESTSRINIFDLNSIEKFTVYVDGKWAFDVDEFTVGVDTLSFGQIMQVGTILPDGGVSWDDISEGIHDITVTQTCKAYDDGKGNTYPAMESPKSAALRVDIDTTPWPVPTFTASLSGQSITFSGFAFDENTPLRVYEGARRRSFILIDFTPIWITTGITGPFTQVAETTTGMEGYWSTTIDNVPSGEHVYMVRQSDIAGNFSDEYYSPDPPQAMDTSSKWAEVTVP